MGMFRQLTKPPVAERFQPVLDPTPSFGGNFNIMKAFVFLCLLSALASPVCSQASEHGCEKLVSTAAKVHCLGQKTLAAEAKMNQAFDHALSAYLPNSHQEEDLSATPKIKEIVEGEDRSTVAALRESQSEWLSYRSSACSAVEHKYEGGTASSEAAEACRLELTEQRTKWLRSNFDDEGISRTHKAQQRLGSTKP
jgi:uncharacterized protein YecT (DUF1311 family)